jgi:hypothetical protein
MSHATLYHYSNHTVVRTSLLLPFLQPSNHPQDPGEFSIAPATFATSGVICRGAGTPLLSLPDYS